MKKIEFTSEQTELIINKYNSGIPTTKLGKEFNCSHATIKRVLVENGIKIQDPRNRINIDELNIIKDLYINKKISITKLSEQFGYARKTLSKRLQDLGVEIINEQNKTKFNENIFDVIDTEEKAYWLGFIFADGYIDSSPLCLDKKSKYGFELSLKGLDVEHLQKFNIFMKHNKDNVKVGYVNCENKKLLRCRWGIVNKHLWETLNSYGCTPNKSLTLEFPEEKIFTDKSLIRHFIRGYFDGDGCISYYKTNPNNDNSNYTEIAIFTGWKKFFENLVTYLPDDITYETIRQCTDKNCFELRFSTKNSSKLLNYLYKDCNIYLSRKFNRYKFFKDGCRSAKELAELLASENGEGCDANPVISEDINKSSTL